MMGIENHNVLYYISTMSLFIQNQNILPCCFKRAIYDMKLKNYPSIKKVHLIKREFASVGFLD